MKDMSFKGSQSNEFIKDLKSASDDLQPIFQKYMKAGYSWEQVHYLLSEALSTCCSVYQVGYISKSTDVVEIDRRSLKVGDVCKVNLESISGPVKVVGTIVQISHDLLSHENVDSTSTALLKITRQLSSLDTPSFYPGEYCVCNVSDIYALGDEEGDLNI